MHGRTVREYRGEGDGLKTGRKSGQTVLSSHLPEQQSLSPTSFRKASQEINWELRHLQTPAYKFRPGASGDSLGRGTHTVGDPWRGHHRGPFKSVVVYLAFLKGRVSKITNLDYPLHIHTDLALQGSKLQAGDV